MRKRQRRMRFLLTTLFVLVLVGSSRAQEKAAEDDLVRRVLELRLKDKLREEFREASRTVHAIARRWAEQNLSDEETKRHVEEILGKLFRGSRDPRAAYAAHLQKLVKETVHSFLADQDLKGLKTYVAAILEKRILLASKIDGIRQVLPKLTQSDFDLSKAAWRKTKPEFERRKGIAERDGKPFDPHKVWDEIYASEFKKLASKQVLKKLGKNWMLGDLGTIEPEVRDGISKDVDERVGEIGAVLAAGSDEWFFKLLEIEEEILALMRQEGSVDTNDVEEVARKNGLSPGRAQDAADILSEEHSEIEKKPRLAKAPAPPAQSGRSPGRGPRSNPRPRPTPGRRPPVVDPPTPTPPNWSDFSFLIDLRMKDRRSPIAEVRAYVYDPANAHAGELVMDLKTFTTTGFTEEKIYGYAKALQALLEGSGGLNRCVDHANLRASRVRLNCFLMTGDVFGEIFTQRARETVTQASKGWGDNVQIKYVSKVRATIPEQGSP